ncbi:MAG TPA: hypothetical protein EYG18_00555 [Micavibrio sp.]|nr:hypothetical protein [Micavibrio sp.]HIL27740.1 hypothetical protein [Micavibrio sp.]
MGMYFIWGRKIQFFMRILLVLIMAFVMLPSSVMAQDAVPRFNDTQLPLPRFVSLRSDKAYIRSGPAMRYPVKWVLIKDDMPVEIIQEFDHWRKIRTIEADEGWIHKSLLSGKRTVMVNGTELVPMRQKNEAGAKMLARLEPYVIAAVEECTGQWCLVSTGGFEGWIERNSLWGVYESEELN